MAVVASENYRSTLGFVTDVAPEVHVTSAGWTGGFPGSTDDSAVIDRRLAGVVYKTNDGTQATRVITLPAPGTYTVRLALGYTAAQTPQYLQIRDNITALHTINKPGGNTAGQWFDANGTAKDAATWASTYAASGVNLTFASTTLRLALGNPSASGAESSTIAHFSVETVGETAVSRTVAIPWASGGRVARTAVVPWATTGPTAVSRSFVIPWSSTITGGPSPISAFLRGPLTRGRRFGS